MNDLVYNVNLTPEINYPENLLKIFHKICVSKLVELLAHQLNNALTSMNGYIQMATTLKKDAIYKKTVNVFSEISSDLREFIENLMLFAKNTPGEFSLIDAKQSTLTIYKLLKRHLEKRDIEWIIDSKVNHPLWSNNSLISLINLIYVLNARDRFVENGEKGEIKIDLIEKERYLEMAFYDNCSKRFDLLENDKLVLDKVTSFDPYESLAPLALINAIKLHKNASYSFEYSSKENSFIIQLPIESKS